MLFRLQRSPRKLSQLKEDPDPAPGSWKAAPPGGCHPAALPHSHLGPRAQLNQGNGVSQPRGKEMPEWTELPC